MDSQSVAAHYNSRPQIGVEKRKYSTIYNMKNYNNWVKSLLIAKYTRAGHCVLDLCCGKGGDLLKWTKAQVSHLMGFGNQNDSYFQDIANVSIQQAQERYNDLNSKPFTAKFESINCFTVISCPT